MHACSTHESALMRRLRSSARDVVDYSPIRLNT